MMDEIYLTTKELSEYLHDNPHVETIRRWVRNGTIPFMKREKKKGIKIYFKKSEIDLWRGYDRKL